MALAIDAELAQDTEGKSGSSDDPDQFTDSESLGARHRRNVGYSAKGAEEHDRKLNLAGHAPLKSYVGKHNRAHLIESRNIAFKRGLTTI
jgi:hypothetical protein